MPILPLHEARGSSIVGGKASQLGALMRFGVNVPDGFVVTASEASKLTDSTVAAIHHQFDKLGAHYVAVRSSATVEDSSDATWAGQFDTFLFVRREQLIEKIEQCMASASSARASAYRRMARNSQNQSVAVIVQTMVPSDVSGVCFSVHPVTQDANQIVVEAAYGLGEAVVSGEVTPDNYVVSRQPRSVTERSIASQDKALVFSEKHNGTTWANVDKPSAQKLTDGQILELAVTAERLENHFGHPVDIEWAFYKGELYILQSRPITTLQ